MNNMKKISYILLILTISFCAGINFSQTKTKKKVIRNRRILGRMIVKPKIEQEDWQEYENAELKIKLFFPKTPTLSTQNYSERYSLEAGVEVKSTVIQSYINTDFYMLEIREYPKSFLPSRTDLGENYGAWLKRYILSRTTIIRQNNLELGRFKVVEFIYQQTPAEFTIHRAFVVGQKLYQLIVQFEIKNGETLEQTLEKNKAKTDKFLSFLELGEEELIESTVGE